jgi:hypothetical protein
VPVSCANQVALGARITGRPRPPALNNESHCEHRFIVAGLEPTWCMASAAAPWLDDVGCCSGSSGELESSCGSYNLWANASVRAVK